MTYDALGPGPLDYLPCHYGASKLTFRGPKRDLSMPYVAFIGTTETYGKFIAAPFPSLVQSDLGKTCANFGQVTAGIDAFVNDPFVIKATCQADVTVVQEMGAQNMSNRFYSVHPRRNDRFVTASPTLQAIYREVDFSDFHFNKHKLRHLLRVAPERFDAVREELQNAWMARMQFLLSQIKGKSILLWFADHAPHEDSRTAGTELDCDPLFITRHMINTVRSHATSYLEVIASPQAQSAGTDGMVFAEMDSPAAAKLMGLAAHQEAADAVVSEIRKLA